MATLISFLEPDIVCLQECDIHAQLHSSLKEAAPSLDYRYEFAEKGKSPCLGYEGNLGPDGVAVFFKSSVLTLLDRQQIAIDADDNRRALALTLRHRDGFLIHVISVHLKAKRQFSDVRLSEGKILLDHLRRTQKCDAVFIAGDFNAEPEEPVIQAMKRFETFRLQSAYEEALDGREPEFTTWKIRNGPRSVDGIEEKHTIDYIFYSGENASLSKVLNIPLDETIGAHALPSDQFPSDHLNLFATFNLSVTC